MDKYRYDTPSAGGQPAALPLAACLALADALQDINWELVTIIPMGYVPAQQRVVSTDKPVNLVAVMAMVFRHKIHPNQKKAPELPSWKIEADGSVVFPKDDHEG